MTKARALALAMAVIFLLGVGRVYAQNHKDEDKPGLPVAVDGAAESPEWDPWEPVNENVFRFNREVDRFVLKPVARGYDALLPDAVKKGIANALDNLDVTRRLVNSLLQLKFAGAGREAARFSINSTIGIAGLFDVALDCFHIEESDKDTGQTLGIYGIGPGPYVILPFLQPLTVRDLFGYIADQAMYPLGYFIPTGAVVGMSALERIGERAYTLDSSERFELDTVDLYGAVRNAYFQK
ncbi:MAG: MlaA family lipoprotein, partial [Candidatus Binatia bacterium]